MPKLSDFADLKKVLAQDAKEGMREDLHFKRYADAYEKLRSLTQTETGSPEDRRLFAEVCYGLGKERLSKGEFSSALEAFQKAQEYSRLPGLDQRVHLVRQRRTYDPVSEMDPEGVLPELPERMRSWYRFGKERKLFTQPERLGFDRPDNIAGIQAPSVYRWLGDENAGDRWSCSIRTFKQGHNERLCRVLGKVLADFLVEETDFLRYVDYVVPVPPDPDRYQERGDDIVYWLAYEVQNAACVPLVKHALKRTRSGCRSRDLRKDALEAFYALDRTDSVRGKNILLVDDITTTGNTLSVCASLLKKAGAGDIYAAALAVAESTPKSDQYREIRKVYMPLARQKTLAHWHCLSRVPNLGPSRIKALVEKFGSAGAVFGAAPEEILEIPRMPRKVAPAIVEAAQKIPESERVMTEQEQKAETCGGRIVVLTDRDYPVVLHASNACAPLLYTLGDLGKYAAAINTVAVVGTRQPVTYALTALRALSTRLAERGWVIVSGMAEGVDSAAHVAALGCEGGTIACLGCGPDVVYPRDSRDLHGRIAQHGLLVSEYPFGRRVNEVQLKKRNKITVGLSQAVFVVQAARKSGTMNAVRAAREQNKPVLALSPPKKADGGFDGNEYLIEEGIATAIEPETELEILEGLIKGQRPI